MKKPLRSLRYAFPLAALAASGLAWACSSSTNSSNDAGATTDDAGGDAAGDTDAGGDSGSGGSGGSGNGGGAAGSGGSGGGGAGSGGGGGSGGGSGSCTPVAIGSYTSAPFTDPAGPSLGKCTDTQITNYFSCISGTTSACTSFDTAGADQDCKTCLTTPTNGKAPPLVTQAVEGGTSFSLNQAGCTGLRGGHACGQAVASREGCEKIACSACADSPNDFSTCAAAADQDGGCGPFSDKEGTSCAADSGIGDCFPHAGESQDAVFKRVMKAFCGTP